MRTRLKPMDIITHDNKLWVVTTAHLVCESGQAVNLSLYDKDNTTDNRKENVPACECKIIKDMEEREHVGDGIMFYPDIDFKERWK